jgi:hypothetical protein
MTGSESQIEWAERIRETVDAEFDRVAKAFHVVADQQSAADREHTLAVVAIVERKRAEVMSNDQAGYFIHDWQDLRDQVRQLIGGDAEYRRIRRDRDAAAKEAYDRAV